MNRNRLIWLAAAAVIATVAWVAVGMFPRWLPGDEGLDQPVQLTMQSSGGRSRVELQRGKDGSYWFGVKSSDGDRRRLSPPEFAELLYQQQVKASFLGRLFNISTPAGVIWVSLGLMGQIMFTGRMLVQWLASERHKRSVVPPVFWWLSIIGSAMLLAYFLWRRDIVGVLGQAFGLAIYLRNIHLIHGARRSEIEPVIAQSS